MISIGQFTGIIPKIDSTKLPDNAASESMDCVFTYGKVSGFPLPHDVGAPFTNSESGYVYIDSDDSTKFYSFPYDADFVRSPVQQDDHKRIYWTGKNAGVTEFKFMRVDDNLASVTPAVTYKVGVAQFVTSNVAMNNAIDINGTAVSGFTAAEQAAAIGGYSIISAEPPVEWSSLTDVKTAVLLIDEDGETIRDVTADLTSVASVGDTYRGWFTQLKFTLAKTVEEYTLAQVSGIKYAKKTMLIGIDGSVSTTSSANVWYSVTYGTDGTPIYALKFIEFLNGINLVDGDGASLVGSYVSLSDGTTGDQLGSAKVMTTTKLSVAGTAFPSELSSAPSVTELETLASATARLAVSITATMDGVTSTALFIHGETLKNAWADGSGISGGLEQGSTDYEWLLNMKFGEDLGLEQRAYIFTFVNRLGEESAPWGLTEISINAGAERVKFFINVAKWVSNFASMQTGRYPLHGIRVYRTSYGSSGNSSYFYVGTVKPTGETYTILGEVYLGGFAAEGSSVVFYDDVKSAALGSACTTVDFVSDVGELQKLQGLTVLYNGILAAFKDNEVWYCEPYMPWAWKRGNVHTLAHRVMALIPQEQGVYILTENCPYYASGATPGEMVPSKIPGQYPCLNKRAAAVISGSTVYLSADGPVYLEGGNCRVDTGAFNREIWRKYIGFFVLFGGEVRLAAYGHRMLIYFTTPVGSVCGYIYDMESQAWTQITTQMKIAITLPPQTSNRWTDNLAYCTGSENWKIFGYDLEETMLWKWSSKDFVLAKPTSFGVAQLLGTGSVKMTITADDVIRHVENITLTTSGTTVRLPSGFIASKWRVSLEALQSKTELRGINMAATALELANA